MQIINPKNVTKMIWKISKYLVALEFHKGDIHTSQSIIWNRKEAKTSEK